MFRGEDANLKFTWGQQVGLGETKLKLIYQFGMGLKYISLLPTQFPS